MKMKFYPIFCFLLFFVIKITKAQDTTSYYGKSQYIFEHVDRSQIASGLLSEYGIEFMELANYDGIALTDSNYVGLQEWRLLYTSLYSAQINNNAAMHYLDTINNRVLNCISLNQPISFAVLHYNYQSLRSDAVSANLLSVSNDQLYDVPGRPHSPYQTNQVFAVAPIRQAAVLGNNDIIFRPELFFANTGKTVAAMAIAVADTSNYQTVAFNTPFTINFTEAGFVDITIRITYTDASICYAHTKLLVYPQPGGNEVVYNRDTNMQPLRFGGGRVSTNEAITATQTYLGQVATGDITIQLALGNTTGQIRKPLIVVEGFDIDNSYNVNEFIGSLPDVLNDALDETHDYDLIFLNFANATDYIQRNAYLLQRVIEEVNSRKTTYNGNRQDNVIIGLSMGGLVVRYALRNMELNSVNHETRLFISHDTPHHGANVPVGAQVAVQHLAPFELFSPSFSSSFPFINIKWEDMFPDLVRADRSFNSPAAKQMLIQRYILGPSYNLIAENSFNNSFYTELNTMGWPLNCKNLTLSNGACNGTRVFADNSRIFEMIGARPMTYGGNLWRSAVMTVMSPVSPVVVYGGNVNPLNLLIQFPLSLISTKSSVNLDFRINAVPQSGVGEVYRADIYVKRKIAWVINSTSYIMKTRINSISGTLPLDNAQGGLYDLNEFGVNAALIQDNLPEFFNGIQSSVLQPRFCFIPTVSSLAISNPWQNLNNNLCNAVNCLNPSGVRNFFAPAQNQIHISYTQPSSNWILQWQEVGFDCAKICEPSLFISGPAYFCTDETYQIPNLPTEANVTWTVTGGVSISGVNDVNPISLTKGTGGKGTLTAIINTACGTFLVTKDIHAGVPSQPITIIDGRISRGVSRCIGGYSYISLQETIDDDENTEYEWVKISGNFDFHAGNGPYAMVGGMGPGSGMIQVRKKNSCGWGVPVNISVRINNCYSRLIIYPNPASEVLTISYQESEYSETGSNLSELPNLSVQEKQISLFNDRGTEVRTATLKSGETKIVLDTRDLPNGRYYLHIREGKEITKQQIIIEH